LIFYFTRMTYLNDERRTKRLNIILINETQSLLMYRRNNGDTILYRDTIVNS